MSAQTQGFVLAKIKKIKSIHLYNFSHSYTYFFIYVYSFSLHCYSDQLFILLFSSIDSVHMVLLLFTLQLLGLWVTENFTRMQLGPSSYLDNKLIIFNAVNIEVTATVSTKFHLHQKFKGIQNKTFSWFNCILRVKTTSN